MDTKRYKAAVISLGSVSSQMTATAMREHFREVDELQIKDFEIVLGQKNPVLYQGKPLAEYDCYYVKGSFRYATIAQSLTSILYTKAYMPILPQSFSVVHDKLLTHIQLQSHGIPMPKTYLSSTPHAAKELLKNLNYPIIMKFPRGTQGKGVMFADSYAAASSLLDALQSINQSFLIQEFMDTGGVDVRVLVVGDRVVAAMKRKAASGDVRSNVHAGGSTEAYEVTPLIRRIALETAKSIGAEVCGVDILDTPKGPMVIEANLSPGLQGITAATNKDIAGEIASFFYQSTDTLRTAQGSPNAQELLDEISESSTIDTSRSIFAGIDMRGKRILLPELVSVRSDIQEGDECTFTFEKGRIEIRRGA